MRLAQLTALATATLTLTAAPLVAQEIDTRNGVEGFVDGGSGIFAQTFTASAGATTLDSFSFWIARLRSGGEYDYRTFIYAFDGGNTVGPALFTSDLRTASSATIAAGRQDFVTGGIGVTPDALYIAIIQRAEGGFLHVGSTATLESGFASTYAGGSFAVGLFYNADPAAANYLTNVIGDGGDLMFVADFSTSVVPEPATVLLLGGGLLVLGVGGVARRRRLG